MHPDDCRFQRRLPRVYLYVDSGSILLCFLWSHSAAATCSQLLSLAGDRAAGQPRGTLPPSRPTDPRLFIDSDGLTPFVLARNRHHLELVSMLNPFMPLSAAFDAEAPADRPLGVAPLQQIAAKVVYIYSQKGYHFIVF